MKPFKKFSFFIILIFLLKSTNGFNQNIQETDSINLKLLSAARDIMTSAKTCALITIDSEGRPRVRVMDPFSPENDFTVWFGTNAKSRKVEQIKNDPKVTLYYLEPNNSGYVMLHGIAQLVFDQAEKDNRWKTEWEAFYPNKEEDYLLIKISPQWLEVISYTHGIIGDHKTWEPPKVIFD
jgi:general stress protein 26